MVELHSLPVDVQHVFRLNLGERQYSPVSSLGITCLGSTFPQHRCAAMQVRASSQDATMPALMDSAVLLAPDAALAASKAQHELEAPGQLTSGMLAAETRPPVSSGALEDWQVSAQGERLPC